MSEKKHDEKEKGKEKVLYRASFSITREALEAFERKLAKDGYLSTGEFFRDAIRRYLKGEF